MSHFGIMEVDTSSATTWRVINIIKEECTKAGNPVEEALICCTLKMIYDNPKNGFDNDLPMDRHAVRRLIGKILSCSITFYSIMKYYKNGGTLRTGAWSGIDSLANCSKVEHDNI